MSDDIGEMTQAILAQGVRLSEQNERLIDATAQASATRAEHDAATDKRLDLVEKDVVAGNERLVAIKEQLTDIKARLDRPSGLARMFDAFAVGAGKFLENKVAVVVLLLILAGLLGLTITTPLGNVGASEGDPVAQDDDDGGGDVGDRDDGGSDLGGSDAIAFPR